MLLLVSSLATVDLNRARGDKLGLIKASIFCSCAYATKRDYLGHIQANMTPVPRLLAFAWNAALSCSLFISPSGPAERWRTASGHGIIQTWTVNDVCTRVNVKYKSGREVDLHLPQNQFKNGDYFLVSLLPVGRHELFVTHEKGGFLIDQSGHVLREISAQKPTQSLVKGSSITTVHLLDGPFEEGPANRLVARGWNGITFAATYKEPKYPYFVIIDRRLHRIHAYLFAGESIESISSMGNRGWRIGVLDGKTARSCQITNAGRLTIK